MVWLQLAIGLAILTFGRELFWVAVAAVGFVYGMELAPVLFPAEAPAVTWLIALAGGVLGGVLAYLLQWAAVAAAGFLVGGRLALLVVASIPELARSEAVSFIVGGIAGAAIVLVFFDWALILVSAIFGAMMVADALEVGPGTSLLLVGGLGALGAVVQAARLQRPPPATRPAHPA